jgi:hypothetical protein
MHAYQHMRGTGDQIRGRAHGTTCLVGCFGGSTKQTPRSLLCQKFSNGVKRPGNFCRVPAQPANGLWRAIDSIMCQLTSLVNCQRRGGFDRRSVAWSLTRRRRGSILACALQLGGHDRKASRIGRVDTRRYILYLSLSLYAKDRSLWDLNGPAAYSSRRP